MKKKNNRRKKERKIKKKRKEKKNMYREKHHLDIQKKVNLKYFHFQKSISEDRNFQKKIGWSSVCFLLYFCLILKKESEKINGKATLFRR